MWPNHSLNADAPRAQLHHVGPGVLTVRFANPKVIACR